MDMRANRSEFLTSDEVIQRLLTQPALRRRAATCVLHAVRVNNEWRFRKTDLEDWIAREVSLLAVPSGSAA